MISRLTMEPLRRHAQRFDLSQSAVSSFVTHDTLFLPLF
jgi:hypothetical protein